MSVGVARSYNHKATAVFRAQTGDALITGAHHHDAVGDPGRTQYIAGYLDLPLQLAVSSSKAASLPFSPPTSTNPSPAPTPPVMAKPLSILHTCLPVCGRGDTACLLHSRQIPLHASPPGQRSHALHRRLRIPAHFNLGARLEIHQLGGFNCGLSLLQAASIRRQQHRRKPGRRFNFIWRCPSHPSSTGSGCDRCSWHRSCRRLAGMRHAPRRSCLARSTHRPEIGVQPRE